MACTSPLTAYKTAAGDVVFNQLARHGTTTQIQLPCGQCIACRLERSRQWAIRCVHETKLHKQNCFVTLTYADEHLPENGTLRYRDFQLFLKRLRKHIAPARARFYMCGEYGETNPITKENDGGKYRPHYHVCLFGWRPGDLKPWRKNQNGDQLHRSQVLEKLWPFGQVEVGNVTFESAAYVARYVVKKITGKEAKKVYGNRVPEFTNMSRRPGVGAGFLLRFFLTFIRTTR